MRILLPGYAEPVSPTTPVEGPEVDSSSNSGDQQKGPGDKARGDSVVSMDPPPFDAAEVMLGAIQDG